MRVLLVEDNVGIAQGLLALLRQRGHVVDGVATLAAAETALHTQGWDAVLLDLGLPDGDGCDLLARWRAGAPGRHATPPNVPVLILTARDRLGERISGLKLGADDYLVKPFDIDELDARLHAVVRRAIGQAQPCHAWRDLRIDPAARTVLRGDTPVELSVREFDLLLALVQARGRVLTREHLAQLLYGWGEEIASNAIEVHVHHLRRKLGSDIVLTRRGVGYELGGA